MVVCTVGFILNATTPDERKEKRKAKSMMMMMRLIAEQCTMFHQQRVTMTTLCVLSFLLVCMIAFRSNFHSHNQWPIRRRRSNNRSTIMVRKERTAGAGGDRIMGVLRCISSCYTNRSHCLLCCCVSLLVRCVFVPSPLPASAVVEGFTAHD